MVNVLEILLAGAALLLMLPAIVLTVEVFAAATMGWPQPEKGGARGTTGVLVPAHNEASIIAATLRSILAELGTSDRLVVIADNCSDDTAMIASSCGAEVIIRTEPTRRGKGYALDFGVRHLSGAPPDVVVVIDADCQVAPGSIDRLARESSRTARPTQALYLMRSPPNAGIMTRIAEFAWLIKNKVRPMGASRLGLSCQLMGTGMAFPWRCINASNLATGHIVEDLKLGLDLTLAGTPPMFCPQALVTSTFPTSNEGIQSQRARWEHGHLGVVTRELPGLIANAISRRDVQLFGAALELSVPPLALLTLQLTAVWCASALLYWFGHIKIPLAIGSVAALMLFLSVLISWLRFGRRIVSLGALALGAVYALRKIPLYVRFLVARQVNWVRSKRD